MQRCGFGAGRPLGVGAEWGGAGVLRDRLGRQADRGTTRWSIGSAKGAHFAPGTAPFLVDDRGADVKALREDGCHVLDQLDASDHGQFGGVIDPEGNKVELWGPPPCR